MQSTVLITGASTGIGYELSQVFAKNGYDLVLVARSGQKLEALAGKLKTDYGIQAIAIPKDLSEPAAAQELYDDVVARDIAVDVLVNNAGYGINGKFTDISADRHLEMLRLNIASLTTLCNLFGKDMVNRHSGSILNVASTAAFQPGPLMSTYYASKAYVLSFSEALNHELAKDGVIVSVLCPGPTRTEFATRADMQTAGIINTPWLMDAPKVAEICFAGLISGKRIIIPGLMNRLLAFNTRFLPRALATSIAGTLNRK